MAWIKGLDNYNGLIDIQVFDLAGRLLQEEDHFDHNEPLLLTFRPTHQLIVFRFRVGERVYATKTYI